MKLTNIMIGLFLGVGLISSCQSEIDEAKTKDGDITVIVNPKEGE